MNSYFSILATQGRSEKSGFSMVEITVALGVTVFALLTVVALLPMGIKSNQVSTDETRAVNLMTAIIADMRNTRPVSAASIIFGISPLPYTQAGATFPITVNTGIPTITPNPASLYGMPATRIHTFYVMPNETLSAGGAGAIYRLSIIYTRAPGRDSGGATSDPPVGGLAPVEAWFMLSWPAALNPFVAADNALLQGSIESYATFFPPRP